MADEATVTSKGQLVIPASLRREYGIRRGTRVSFRRIKGGIGIYPKSASDIDRMQGIFAGLGLPADLPREPLDRDLK